MKNLVRTEKRHRQSSLFGEILDWMLAPLLIIWPLSMAIEYHQAYSIANSAYDRELKDRVLALSRSVSFENGQITVRMEGPARAILVADELSDVSFQVRGMSNEVIDGSREISPVEFTAETEPMRVYFRDDLLRQREVRVAYVFAQIRGATGAVLVQVAATDEKRMLLASDIIGGVLMSQFALVPMALLLVWFGLSKGLAPLEEMRQTIRVRKPHDLSPIDPADAPEEVRPFIHSINDLMGRLDSSMQAQQRFVADAAHQMRTPLAGLKTQAEVALRMRDSASIEHTMRQIATGADRASRLINQLLSLARADSDVPPSVECLDINLLVKEATSDCVSRAIDKRIDLGFESAGSPAFVDGSAILLREMINNLMDNAIRYSGEYARVTARVVADDAIRIDIEDSGIGIDPDERELVFERFYRVLGTDAEGSGLGLAIVREIATLHYGTVALLPNPNGVGTLARIVLPRSKNTQRTLRAVA